MRKLALVLGMSVAMVSLVSAQSYDMTVQKTSDKGAKFSNTVYSQSGANNKIIKTVSDSAFVKASIVVNNNKKVLITKTASGFSVSGAVTGDYKKASHVAFNIVDAMSDAAPAYTARYIDPKTEKTRKSSIHGKTNFLSLANRMPNNVVNVYKGDTYVVSYIFNKESMTWSKSTDEVAQANAQSIGSPTADFNNNVL